MLSQSSAISSRWTKLLWVLGINITLNSAAAQLSNPVDQQRTQGPSCGTLAQIDIPSTGKEKIIKFFLDTTLKSLSAKDISANSLQKVTQPMSFKAPKVALGFPVSAKEAKDIVQAQSQITEPQLRELVLGESIVDCTEQYCNVTVPIIRSTADFSAHIQTQNGETVFSGHKLRLSFGNSAHLDSNSKSIMSVQASSPLKWIEQTPNLVFKLRINSKGAMSETLGVMEPPRVVLPNQSIKLTLATSKADQDQINNAGSLDAYDAIATIDPSLKLAQEMTAAEKIQLFHKMDLSQLSESASLKLKKFYLQGACGKSIELGYFPDLQSCYIFTTLKSLTDLYLFRLSDFLEMVTDQLNTIIMPMTLQATNELLSQMRILNEMKVLRPHIVLQDEIDLSKNQLAAKSVLAQNLNSFLERFKWNSDARSINLIQDLVQDLESKGQLTAEARASSKSAIDLIQANIRSKTKEILLRYDMQRNGEQEKDLRLTVSSPNYCEAPQSPQATPSVFDGANCDLAVNIPIATLNTWLKEIQHEGHLDGCISTGETDICNSKSKYIGIAYDVDGAPYIEWDAKANLHVLVFPRVNSDIKISPLGLSSFFGLTKDSLTARMHLKPQACEDGKLCFGPQESIGHTLINRKSIFSKIVGLFKLLYLPYNVVANIFVNTALKSVKEKISESKLKLPQFHITEVRSFPTMISVCAQIKSQGTPPQGIKNAAD